MESKENKKVRDVPFKARLPRLVGLGALVLLAASIALIIYSAFWSRSNPEFRMQGFPTSLSEDVVAVVDGYERREMEDGVTKYYIRADRATSFADQHQELENVYIEVYSEDGSASDKLSALKGVYVPGENKDFTTYMAGTVEIETRDALKVRTEQLTYRKIDETAAAEELVEFERLNVRGRSTGALVKVKEKVLELHRGVSIESQDGEKTSTLNAGSAVYDQGREQIELQNGVEVKTYSGSEQPREVLLSSNRASVFLDKKEDDQERQIGRAEMFGSVSILTTEAGKEPTRIDSQYALYQRPLDRFDLRGSVRIRTASEGEPTEAVGEHAVYEQPQGRMTLSGSASVAQKSASAAGNSIFSQLNDARRVTYAEITGNAVVRQVTPEQTAEVRGPKVRADFGENAAISKAVLSGAGTAIVVPADTGDYTRLTMSAGRAINVGFKGEGLLENIITDGRTSVNVEVPNNSPDAANKALTADAVSTRFGPDGRFMTAANAIGNAELVVTPLVKNEQAYVTNVKAPRFDCDFFGGSNNPKQCIAASKTKTVRTPVQPGPTRGTQNITADRLTANFDAATKDMASLEATGSAKFTERDRNASSTEISYTAADKTVRMRGGEPAIWDSEYRARAPEIDWDTANERSELRGGASTTYFSARSAGGATPFGKSDRPVYVTAESARFNHRAETAVFEGNARGWQDSNYVRGDSFAISETEGTFTAVGRVQSLLYDVKRSENGTENRQPINVSAGRMNYTRNGRHVRYEQDVDIRQGPDRAVGSRADIYLDEDNQPVRTEIRDNVVITQPTRRASADLARYETAAQTLFLQGRPATVEDKEQGRSQGSQITIDLKNNRFAGEGTTRQDPSGRVRSTYRVKGQ